MWNEIKNRPSVIIFLSIVIGTLLFRYTNLIFIPFLFLGLTFLFIEEKISLIIVIILLSAWWTSKNYEKYINSIREIEKISNDEIRMVCSVKDASRYGLKVDKITIDKTRYYGVLEVKVRENTYQYGDKLYIVGKLYKNRVIDIDKKLFQERIIGTVYPNKVKILSKPSFSLKRSLYIIRTKIRDKVSLFLNPEERELTMAMVLGISDELPYDIYKNFKVTGLIHTLVVSGAQVSIIVSSIIPFLTGLQLLILFPLVFLYALITGLEISVIRASIMMGINILARIIHEDYDPPSSLAFSGIVILLFDPLSIFSSSFQLSFLATFSLISIAPYLRVKRLDFMMPTITVQGILAPLLLYKNGSLPLISFPINIIVSPLISILTIGSFILALSTFTFPFITYLISIIIKPIIHLLLRIIVFGNKMSYDIKYSPSIIELIATYIIIGGLIYIGYTRLYKDDK
ncbi:MAG: ComEC/Rec2 family competence protein [bacterium]